MYPIRIRTLKWEGIDDMSNRKPIETVKGQPTIDGAGVKLIRVLGNETTKDFDPFLMLDFFDSKNPKDYMAGFPMHPHRGIETVTYLAEGEMEHQDSLGNKGVIKDGESQWMTAGSGIMHQEMPSAKPSMLGLQLWINLKHDEKMTHPKYNDITAKDIKSYKDENGEVRVISGQYKDVSGFDPQHVKASIFDIRIEPGREIVIDTDPEENAFVFLLRGGASVEGEALEFKAATRFSKGDKLVLRAGDEGAYIVYFAGKPLNEEIAWAGPIVMNTRAELAEAFDELDHGTFVKHANT